MCAFDSVSRSVSYLRNTVFWHVRRRVLYAIITSVMKKSLTPYMSGINHVPGATRRLFGACSGCTFATGTQKAAALIIGRDGGENKKKKPINFLISDYNVSVEFFLNNFRDVFCFSP